MFSKTEAGYKFSEKNSESRGSGVFQPERHMAHGKGRANSRAHVWDAGATRIPSAPGSPLGEARNAVITEARLHGGAVAGVSQPWRPCPQTTGTNNAGRTPHGGPPSLVQSTPQPAPSHQGHLSWQLVPSRALVTVETRLSPSWPRKQEALWPTEKSPERASHGADRELLHINFTPNHR